MYTRHAVVGNFVHVPQNVLKKVGANRMGLRRVLFKGKAK